MENEIDVLTCIIENVDAHSSNGSMECNYTCTSTDIIKESRQQAIRKLTTKIPSIHVDSVFPTQKFIAWLIYSLKTPTFSVS